MTKRNLFHFNRNLPIQDKTPCNTWEKNGEDEKDGENTYM
jgi:hypothetical protein